MTTLDCLRSGHNNSLPFPGPALRPRGILPGSAVRCSLYVGVLSPLVSYLNDDRMIEAPPLATIVTAPISRA